VRPPSGPAGLALTARSVDLAHDAASQEMLRSRLDNAHELMTGNARERVIATRQLDVRVADSGEQHAHPRFILILRLRDVIANAQ
jgi:hypothetical protein